MYCVVVENIKDWMDKIWNMNNHLYCIILRGNIGVGKSTFARDLVEVAKYNFRPIQICSADHFFYDARGNYCFEGHKIHEAHDQCFKHFVEACEQNSNVIIGM